MTSPLLSHARRAIALSCASALLFTASAATSPSLAIADEMAEAKDLYRSGEKHYKAGEYAEAANDFTRAYELSNKPELLYYIARSWEELGELVKSQDHYQRYIDELPDAKNADEVIDKIIEIQERIANELGRIKITTPEEGRDIFVDGAKTPECQTPCMLVLKPGPHSIRVPGPKGSEAIEKLEAVAGKRDEIAIEFDLVKEGSLLVSTDAANGTLRVGKISKSLPLSSPIILEEGSYPVTITGDDDKTWSGEVDITGDAQTSLVVPLQHTGGDKGTFNTKRVGAITLASAGVGLLLGGAFMGLQTRKSFANLDASRQAGRPIDPASIEQGKSQQRVANLLMLSGGLAIGGGAGLFAWDYFGNKPADEKAPPSEGSSTTDDTSDDTSDDVELLE